jgi:hypothetical protein
MHDRVVRSSRVFIAIGFGCLLVAASSMLIGFTDKPWLTLVSAGAGSIVFITAMVIKRAQPDRPTTDHHPVRDERLVRVVISVVAGLGLVAVLVALLVAEGDARGHAVGHLVVGFLCLGLFAALALAWHPDAGGGAATQRGLVLILLAAAALGGFLESLGGAGYDAANEHSRIEVLTTLHSIAVPFGTLVVAAIPVGLVTAIVVLIPRVTRRDRTARP